jgi:hypothetical protein
VDRDGTPAAALLDVVWSMPAYERLVGVDFDGDDDRRDHLAHVLLTQVIDEGRSIAG